MVFFIGLKPEVKTKISPVAFSTASSSLRPTTASGGMLPNREDKDTIIQTSKTNSEYIL